MSAEYRRAAMNTQARVLLSENTVGLRGELWEALGKRSNITVVGDPDEAYKLLNAADRSAPPVVIVDSVGGSSSGADTIARIKLQYPAVAIVAITEEPDVEDIRQLVNAGASCCLPREAITTDLGDAVAAAARGEGFLSPAVATMILGDYHNRLDALPSRSARPLTEREAQVLQLVSEGNTNDAIAHNLGVSVKTVETHRAHLMRKLDVHDRTDLVKYALRTGVIVMD
jgi:two-component system response regulator NreC